MPGSICKESITPQTRLGFLPDLAGGFRELMQELRVRRVAVSVEYEDGNTGTFESPRHFRSHKSMMRGLRSTDFHALRHTFATGLGSCDMKEALRVKLARHSDWWQTDRYTDPASLPLFAEMEKFAALLPSSIPSFFLGNRVQSRASLSKRRPRRRDRAATRGARKASR